MPKHMDPAKQVITGNHLEETTRTLKLKLSFLAHDLRTFQSSPNAQARLSTSVVSHNIGPPYLMESEAAKALATPLHTFRSVTRNPKRKCDENDSKILGTFLDERLGEIVENRAKNREGHGKADFVLCASHDLAPILQVALGLERGFDDAKEFKAAYKRWDRVQCGLKRRKSNVGHNF